MDQESTKGNALADVACSLLTPCCHLGDDDSDGYYEGFDDGFVENCDEDFEKEKSEISCQGQHFQKVFLFI